MSEWLPIETAPRDGRQIDLWVEIVGNLIGMRISDCRWDESVQSWRRTPEGYTVNYSPTHWMPIPDGPKPPPEPISREQQIAETEARIEQMQKAALEDAEFIRRYLEKKRIARRQQGE